MSDVKNLGNWTENQLKYIRFLGRGKTDVTGNKYTKEKFAELIGVHWTTLYDWQALPGFKQAVLEFTLSENLDKLPLIAKTQMLKSLGGKDSKKYDTPAAGLVMKMYGSLIDKQETELSGQIGITINTIDYKNATD